MDHLDNWQCWGVAALFFGLGGGDGGRGVIFNNSYSVNSDEAVGCEWEMDDLLTIDSGPQPSFGVGVF